MKQSKIRSEFLSFHRHSIGEEEILEVVDTLKNGWINTGPKSKLFEERLKQYLSLALPKGVKSGERRIRILPTKDGSSPFQEVYFHNTQVQGKWMKI